jgi:hypothetical protein
MLYKCDHCNYYSKRLSNLVRHKKRLYPCNKPSKVNVCKREEEQNVTISGRDVEVSGRDVEVSGRDVEVSGRDVEVSGRDVEVSGRDVEVSGTNLKCLKCNKIFLSKKGLNNHTQNCDGLDPRQCRICLKIFSSRYGKYQHMKYVKCSAPISQHSSSNTPNNINNSTNNSHNNNINIDNSDNSIINNIQINIRADFDKITNDHIQHIVSQIKQTDYLQMIANNIDIGKYVIPRTMEQIYFNDNFPEMQTLKKERRNDKLVGVHVGNGKWEKRLMDDIYNTIIGRVEDFHTKYFQFIEDKYKDVKVGSPRWKQIMRPIKTFGNTMLWYEGFNGDKIENMGIQLNYPDDDDDEIEKLRDKRNKEMEQLISEKVYEETLSKEKACIQ